MKQRHFEFYVGLFMALGILCLAILSLQVARNDFFAANGYEVQAVFTNCSGLQAGSPIMIAGVEIGRIKSIGLEDYEAKVVFVIKHGIVLQKDAMASIKTKGLIGEKYVEITPGGDDRAITPGGLLINTEPALDIESLISKYVQGSISAPKPAAN
ncbi:MAG: outer membrane lipid asymmetry maintenance protein MlaD [Chthoniobacteraceae bacterium]